MWWLTRAGPAQRRRRCRHDTVSDPRAPWRAPAGAVPHRPQRRPVCPARAGSTCALAYCLIACPSSHRMPFHRLCRRRSCWSGAGTAACACSIAASRGRPCIARYAPPSVPPAAGWCGGLTRNDPDCGMRPAGAHNQGRALGHVASVSARRAAGARIHPGRQGRFTASLPASQKCTLPNALFKSTPQLVQYDLRMPLMAFQEYAGHENTLTPFQLAVDPTGNLLFCGACMHGFSQQPVRLHVP